MPVENLPDYLISLRGKRILVVEEEAIVAMLFDDELFEAGAQVVGPAGSVDDALLLIEAAATDGGLSAAVLDIKLEGEAVKPVADTLAALGVPFLFATGYAEHCDTGGHNSAPVLRKPFAPHELLVAVSALKSVCVPLSRRSPSSSEVNTVNRLAGRKSARDVDGAASGSSCSGPEADSLLACGAGDGAVAGVG